MAVSFISLTLSRTQKKKPMATNDITLYIPPTEEEVMLIQPNNVTFGQYSVTEWQENLLTLISDQIQQHMTREKQLPKDLFNQPVVEIKCDEAGGKNNKSKVLKEAIAMMRKNFSFRWVHPNIHQTVETFGVVITTVHNIKGTNRVALTLNPWAIPFLLYYGTGVGGTKIRRGKILILLKLPPPINTHFTKGYNKKYLVFFGGIFYFFNFVPNSKKKAYGDQRHHPLYSSYGGRSNVNPAE